MIMPIFCLVDFAFIILSVAELEIIQSRPAVVTAVCCTPRPPPSVNLNNSTLPRVSEDTILVRIVVRLSEMDDIAPEYDVVVLGTGICVPLL